MASIEACLQHPDKHLFRAAEALLPVPQQVNIHIGDAFLRRQLPQQPRLDIRRHYMLGQATYAKPGNHQSAHFFKAG
ncbi:hypothetical protein D3C79_1085040 [compost metagenome]